MVEAMSRSATEISCLQSMFSAVAEEMGGGLARSAYSVNIKERKDFSCAVFDQHGGLLAQAAHIPVHLGAMPRSVEAAISAFPSMQPGDGIVLNDPFEGGTHLPDVTIVSPVFLDASSHPAFFLATRAHHADVGGMSPGSLPLSTSIYQEGICLPPVRLAESGRLVRDIVEILCANSRTPEERRGDLRAQWTAHAIGEKRLLEISQRMGTEEVLSAQDDLQEYGRNWMSELFRQLPVGSWQSEDCLEDDGLGGGPVFIRLSLALSNAGAALDFCQSDDAMRGSLNAVKAITESAAIYCFCCMLNSLLPTDVSPPVNAGSMGAIDVRTRPGSIVDARRPSAVAGGNVETSQRIVDVIFSALAQAVPDLVPAQAQGTMNNVTFGGLRPDGSAFACYETLGGGMGANRAASGEHALQVHMTNTLNTPIEALEYDMPLHLSEYGLVEGSGGTGLYAGGDGLVREWIFHEAVQVALLTERRVRQAAGLAGGGPGRSGCNYRRSGDGALSSLPGKFQAAFAAGEGLRVETPGGGAWGIERSES